MKAQLSTSGRMSGFSTYPLINTFAFLGLYFLFAFLWVDTRLILHSHGQLTAWPIYVPDTSSFSGVPARPGEFSGFLGAYFSHYFGYAWMGALILTGLAGLLCLGTVKVVKGFGGSHFDGWGFVLPVIMLLQNGRYCHFLSDSIELLLTLWFFWLYMRLPLGRVGLRLLVFFVLLGAVYVLAAPAYVVFVFLGVIYEFFIWRNRLAGIGGLILSLAAPLLLNGIYFDNALSVAYSFAWFGSAYSAIDTVNKVLVYVFFLFLPGACLESVFGKRFGRKKGKVRQKDKGGRGREEQSEFFWARYRQSKTKAILLNMVFLIAVSGLVWLGSDHSRRRQMRIIYLARQERWEDMLSEVRVLPRESYNYFTCFNVNRALFHTGQLPNEMFSYPQHPIGLLLTPAEEHARPLQLVRTFILQGDLYYEMGHMNKSENFYYEALALTDYCPWILQRLALINIIKGQPGAARVFLRQLQKDFLYCKWAQSYLDRLEIDPLLSNDIEIMGKRKSMINSDSIKLGSSNALFVPLLTANGSNRMAYEYLMAFYLVNGNLEAFVGGFRHIRKFGYSEIPRHYQEAILLYTKTAGKKVDLQGYQLSPENIKSFDAFFRLSKRYINDPQGIVNEVIPNFKNTYYCYYLFERNLRCAPP